MTSDTPDKPAVKGSFCFTRDDMADYRFVVQEGDTSGIKSAVEQIQDYFGSLIENIGYYSFQCDGAWVVATARQTARRDRVGRPIFEIVGDVLSKEHLGSKWYDFVKAPMKTDAIRWSPQRGEFPASLSALHDFLKACRNSEEPISWAYGVQRIESDTTRLSFDVRFIPCSPKPWHKRICEVVLDWLLGR